LFVPLLAQNGLLHPKPACPYRKGTFGRGSNSPKSWI